MADTFTTNYSFRKVEVGTAKDTWGGLLNDNFDLIDSSLKAAVDAKQTLDATLTAIAAVAWTSGIQVPVLTAADTFALKTVGSAAGNLLDKAAGDALYFPLAGGTVTGAITRSGRGVHPHFNDAGMTSGRIFIQATGGGDPTSAPGDILMEY